MSTKHFLNDPTHLVNTALHSLTLTNPSLALDPANKVIYRRPQSDASSPQPARVSLVSGGGAGHEPSFSAMVGQGMLTAAVSGTIFASPSAEQIRAALQSRVDTSRGVLVTVMNYTGDVLNFGVAVEKARASGVDIEMVVVGDDVGVGRAKAGKVGRRGVAGTVLVHKISGALAATGAPLADVARVARLTAENLVSVGASLEHVHVPGRAALSADELGEGLAEGEVELGMGIHNEAGSGRVTVELPELVRQMLAQLLDQTDKDRAFVNVNSDEVVLLVNNLGGVSVLELAGITSEVATQLQKTHGIKPVRILSGTYMTSLNGLGFSITLLNVVNTDISGLGMIDLLDYPAEVTGWTAPISKETWEARNTAERTAEAEAEKATEPSGLVWDPAAATSALKAGLERVIAAEPEITMYDTIVGDGDCGTGLKRGAEAVLQHIASKPLTQDPFLSLVGIVPVVETTMDGTSGALFSIFLNALLHALRSLPPGPMTPLSWGAALRLSVEALGKYTPARPGDRTLVDALSPFVEGLAEGADPAAAAAAARAGAEGTKGMVPALGRSVYVGGEGFEKVPDPGAWGLACFFDGLAGKK